MRDFTHALAALFLVATAAHADPYDAAADFSALSNPNGNWSYGFTATLGGAFTPYTFTGGFVGNPNVFGWLGFAPGSSSGEPVVVKNFAATVQVAGGMQLDPGQLGVHPGPSNEITVVRWTAPLSGDYSVTAAFESRDRFRGATTDVHVLLNGVSLFSGLVNGGFGPGSGPSYAALLTLGAGDVVDFAVGYGNGNFFFDSTGLAATVTSQGDPIPEPAAPALATAALACIAWRRRARARVSRSPR